MNSTNSAGMAEGLKKCPTGGGLWRTHFGYALVQLLGSGSVGPINRPISRPFPQLHPRKGQYRAPVLFQYSPAKHASIIRQYEQII
jgi:hypothetical protein